MAARRVVSDCRLMPSEKGCSLVIAGPEEEVLPVAIRHAVEDHGEEDTPELRAEIKEMLREE